MDIEYGINLILLGLILFAFGVCIKISDDDVFKYFHIEYVLFINGLILCVMALVFFLTNV